MPGVPWESPGVGAGLILRCVAAGLGAPESWHMIWRGYLRTSAEVSSGKEVRKPASMAAVMVDSAVEHSAPCEKEIRLAMVAYGIVWIGRGMVRQIASTA